ncbi:Peroxisomal acyl-CoA oxidase 3, partial [Operophtera brumata]
MYKWLSASVLKMTAEKVWRLRAEGRYTFQAKNDSQSYNAVTLSIVYGEGGYFSGDQGLLLRDGILSLCSDLSPDAVPLVDTLAPPDFCL